MKTFVISLERAKERKKYIKNHLDSLGLQFELIFGVDGRQLKQEEIIENVDLDSIRKAPEWLNPGAIGCALSHLKVYKRIVEENLKCAFIIEDDIILPNNIKEILEKVGKEIKENEVILLYYVSFKECLLSRVDSVSLNIGDLGLHFPIDFNQPTTAAAYVVHQTTAKSFLNSIFPIRVTADSWGYFIKKEMINSLRCLYPLTTKIKNFKSSIDYINPKTPKGKFLEWVDRNKIPFLFQIAFWIRAYNQKKISDNFKLTSMPALWVKNLSSH